LHGDFLGETGGIDTFYLGEAGAEETVAVADAAGSEGDGNAVGLLQDAYGELAHEGLAVGGTFASDDEGGIADEFAEVESVEQQSDAGLAVGIKVLQEGVTKASGGTSARLLGAVVAEVAG